MDKTLYCADIVPERVVKFKREEVTRVNEKFLESNIEKTQNFVAHCRLKNGKMEIQTLWNHLKETGNICAGLANKIGLKNQGLILGLLHDLGKASQEFNLYISSATGLIDPDSDEYVDSKSKKGKIDHSSAGAQLIHSYLGSKSPESNFVAQILSLIIVSHHSGLIDVLSPNGENNFERRINKSKELTHIDECIENLEQSIGKDIEKILLSEEFVKNMIEQIKSIMNLDDGGEYQDNSETFLFKMGLFVRFLFSCLIDADRMNTADFESPENCKYRNIEGGYDWKNLVDKFEKKINKFEERNKIDKIRREISNKCSELSKGNKGVYQLTVPTGGGKTLSSLRFALQHANIHDLDRIIYVLPYTSIIDQNAEVARSIFEEVDETGKFTMDVVLEHHSNLTPDKENTRQKLLSENWDAPIIFTTTVQFLESLFGYGTRGARRMHQLANAVLVFDEVQTIPIQCVHMFNVAVRFLVETCGATVILCTATQPLLHKINPSNKALKILSEGKIMGDVEELFASLKRVRVFNKIKPGGWTDVETDELINIQLQEVNSLLIIVNTKRTAKSLYEKVKINGDVESFHLSANMCPAHRMDVFGKMKTFMKQKKKVVCVSTQLIEAGIDIDFGCVIRYLAGLDSIAQAAGRCNRNGNVETGKVFIINPENENLDKLKDIKIGAEITQRVLEEYKNNPKNFDGDILSPKLMERYYEYYFYKRSDEMSYNIGTKSHVGRKDSLFNLLSNNKISIEEYRRIHKKNPELKLYQSFMSAAKEFEVIDTISRGIIVPYGDVGKNIILDLCDDSPMEWKGKTLTKAQRYSVNVINIDSLFKKKMIHEVKEETGIFYLDVQYYSDEFGLGEDVVNTMDLLNF